MPDYVPYPFEVNPDDIALDAYQYIASRIIGWVPNEGDLETILIDVHARMDAETRYTASLIPVAIFKYFGRLAGIVAIEPSRASADITLAAVDATGYTIEAGTAFALPISGNQSAGFKLLSDVTIAAGETTVVGTMIADLPGEAASNLGAPAGAVQIVTPLSYLESVTLVEATSGGTDAEADLDYINRLANKLSTLANHPILAKDYAIIARDIAGVWRTLAIDNYLPGTDEVQTITVNATSGTFTLTFAGQTTAAIAYNATAAAVKTALAALSNIEPGDIETTGGPLATSAVSVHFKGQYASTDVGAMTAASGSLVGGTHTATIATATAGVAANAVAERAVYVVGVDEDGNELSGPKLAELDAYLQSLREINFIVNIGSPTYNTIGITYHVTKYAGYDSADLVTAINTALTSYLNQATWGTPTNTGDFSVSARDWKNENKVRIFEIGRVIDQVLGVDHVISITIGRDGGTQAAADLTMGGVVPLPRPGTFTGTVDS